MSAEITADNDYISGLNGRRTNRLFDVRFNYSNSRSVQENSVALAFVDDLRISGNQLHICVCHSLLHRDHDGAQRFHLKSFFENESCTQVQRAGAAHGEIVHRAVYREIANVPSRKDQRAHHERIGGECQSRSVDRNDGAIVPLVEHGIAKCRDENLFDELVREASAAAVRQHDAIVSDSRDWTVQVE